MSTLDQILSGLFTLRTGEPDTRVMYLLHWTGPAGPVTTEFEVAFDADGRFGFAPIPIDGNARSVQSIHPVGHPCHLCPVSEPSTCATNPGVGDD